MDWDLETCAWNGLSKLEIQDNTYNHHNHLASLASFNGSGITNMLAVDLKLGRLEDMGENVSMETSLKNSMPYNMASSSSKRGRPRNRGIGQSNVFCLVDGCSFDLNLCREYHRRHKVCEKHSKTPVVLIGGKEQRFCQQCSRFHSLEEFDEAKRSCRKRLDGHNRRRRKRQPEAFYIPEPSGGYLSSHTGNGMLQFFCPQMNTTSNWTTMSHPDMSFLNTQQTIYQPLLNGFTPFGSRRGDTKLVSPDQNSGCALSLLSRYPSQTSGIYVGPPVMEPTRMNLSSAQVSSTDLNLSSSVVQVSYSQSLEYMESSSSTNASNY